MFCLDYVPLLRNVESRAREVVSLGSLLREPLTNGIFKKPENAGRGTKLVNVYDLYGDTVVDLNRVDRLEISQEDMERYRVEGGDIFFTRSSLKPEGVAWSAYIEDEVADEAVFECHLIRARVNRNRAVPGFISNYARTSIARAYLIGGASVTTMATIDQQSISDLPVVLPPISEQLDLLTRLNTARNARREKFAKSAALLADFYSFVLKVVGITLPPRPKTTFAIRNRQLMDSLNPERYRGLQLERHLPFKSTLAIVGSLLETRCSPEKEAPQESWDWIRIDDLPNQPWQIETIRTQLGKDINGTFFEVEENDILLARLGPTIINAKFVLCPKLQRRTVASSEFLVIRCNAAWEPEAVLWLLRTALYREIMSARSRGATPSRFRLDGDDLLAIPFPTMCAETQARIATEARRRREEVRRLRAAAEAEWQVARVCFEAGVLRTT